MEDVAFERVVRPDSIVRADAMLNIAFERRDVAQMRQFLEDFGLVVCESSGDRQYFRGHGDIPYLVSVTPADRDACIGFALGARSRDDLQKLADATGATVENADSPGGGWRVRVQDPDGLQVDFAYGFERVKPLTGLDSVPAVNTPHHKARVNGTIRRTAGPSPIFKLGHLVLQRPDFRRSALWYMRHFGLIPSDIQFLPDGQPGLGFFRLNRGTSPADHHSVALLGGPGTSLLHVSFETLDLDAVGQGHQHLRARGWTHHWGIGRHVLGSQVFDYWKDPTGDEWEHYADGDVMDASYPTGYSPLTRGSLWSWGDDLPDSMRPEVGVEAVDAIHAAGGFGSIDLSQIKGLMQALSIQPRPWLR